MPRPIIAIVGRPNVGKSTLFNKIVGRRLAIVEDTPGVTRDRLYAHAEWCGRPFSLVDTGGIEPVAKDEILVKTRLQAQLAIDTADVIIFLTDIREGVTATDAEIAAMLQKSAKPIVLACNKSDTPGEAPLGLYEFYNLSIGDPIAISASHGMGTGDLLDAVMDILPPPDSVEEEDDSIKVAVVGKPNAGKSSIINKILGEDRVIVSPIAGTTRDAIDIHLTQNGRPYTFIDTAGMRKKGKIDENIERYSVLRALTAVERAQVALMMIDATEGITEQDTKIAGFAHDNGKATVLALNKWDLVEKDGATLKEFERDVRAKLPFMPYAPILAISAQTGQRVSKIFDLIEHVAAQNARRVTTGALNDCINEAIIKVQPPADKGKRLRIYYATQASIRPPTFVLFVNDKELFHFSYLRYIENQVRDTFGFDGTPLKFIVREKSS